MSQFPPNKLNNHPLTRLASTESANSLLSLQSKNPENTNTENGAPLQVSDNRGSGANEPRNTLSSEEYNRNHLEQISKAKEDPGKALMLVLEELQEIRAQMTTLNKMESTTASLVEQLAAAMNRTDQLETKVNNNEIKVQKLNENFLALDTDLSQHKGKCEEMESKLGKLSNNLAPLEAKVDQHEKQLNELKALKEEMADINVPSDKNITRMCELIDIQKEQVDTFNDGATQLERDWKRDVLAEVDKRFNKIENDKYCNSLKDQA